MSLRDLLTFGLGPASGGVGAADWTADEKAQIRKALGVTGTAIATTGAGTLEAAFAALADDTEIATAVLVAMNAAPPAVNVTLWAGEAPDSLDGGRVPASVSLGVVNANVVRYNSQWMYYGVVSGVSGNVITTTGLKTNPDGTPLVDDKLVAFVGWQVMFYKQVSGLPPTDVFWRATIVSYTESTITVDAMPVGFVYTGGFTVYILPPSFGASAGGATIDGQDVADAMLLAPSGVAAAGSVMDYLANIEEDTGTTLPASIAAISQIVDTNTTDATTAGSITRRRGDSWSIQLTVGSIVGYTSLWFTARGDRDAADTESVLQIKKNASGIDDGLLYVNAAVAATAALGSIAVSNAATGAIIITLDEAVTDDLAPAEIYYDVQVLSGGNVTTPDLGLLTITQDVTRAIL